MSQRTALVSKTILSQCHTFLIHALIDQTSLDFLQNVIGREYIKVIPNLMPLQLIAAGKAVHSERPTLTQRAWSDEKFEASERLNRPEPEVGVDANDKTETVATDAGEVADQFDSLITDEAVKEAPLMEAEVLGPEDDPAAEEA